MNIPKMIAELQAEKQRLDEAILALERLAVGNKTKRRVKPPQRAGCELASLKRNRPRPRSPIVWN